MTRKMLAEVRKALHMDLATERNEDREFVCRFAALLLTCDAVRRLRFVKGIYRLVPAEIHITQ